MGLVVSSGSTGTVDLAKRMRRPKATSLRRYESTTSGCSWADRRLRTTERQRLAREKPTRKPSWIPWRMYDTKAWSGCDWRQAAHSSVRNGVVMRDMAGCGGPEVQQLFSACRSSM